MKKIELADKGSLEKYFRFAKNLCCEYSFQNLFVWEAVYDTRWRIHDGILYIYYAAENSMLMPLSPPPLKSLIKIPEIFSIPRNELYISHVEDEYIKSNPNIYDHFEVFYDQDVMDYVHLIDRLAELKGTKLAKKKNLVSQFERNHPEYQCLPIDSHMKDICLEFAEKWLRKQDNTHIGLAHENIALQTAFRHFKELSLEGIAIFAENKIRAFSIFSRQNEDTYIEHFEKSDPEIKGSAQIINRETARYLKGNAKYLNREQDIGVPGLKKAKNSYDPDMRIGGRTLKFRA